MNPDVITTIAAVLTTVSLLPQTIKTIRTGDTQAISFWMYILYVGGVSFWILAGVVYESWPMIIGNIISVVLAIIILVIKIKKDIM